MHDFCEVCRNGYLISGGCELWVDWEERYSLLVADVCTDLTTYPHYRTQQYLYQDNLTILLIFQEIDIGNFHFCNVFILLAKNNMHI